MVQCHTPHAAARLWPQRSLFVAMSDPAQTPVPPETRIPATPLRQTSDAEGNTVVDLETASGAAQKRDIRTARPFKRWLLEGCLRDLEAPHVREGAHKPHPGWAVVCLTGVDYFSTLGYQPGIAADAGGFRRTGDAAGKSFGRTPRVAVSVSYGYS